MAFFDEIFDAVLDRTGAIGSRIKGFTLEAQRDAALSVRPTPSKRTTIITSTGKRLVFDAAMNISHSFESKVTEFPVEDKGTVSDHVVNRNPSFSVSAMYSDASASLYQGRIVKSQKEFYRDLLEVRDKRETVTLITPLDQYPDLILSGISIPKNAETGKSLFVDLTFIKIRRVSSERTTVFVQVKTSGNTSDKLSTKKDVGDKSSKELGSTLFDLVNPDSADKTRSLFESIDFGDNGG